MVKRIFLFWTVTSLVTGSSGVDVWTFRAVNAGDTTVELGYYPPGNDADPEETATFSIRVK